MPEANEWIERLGLCPHPEGGHYRETYRSTARVGGGDSRAVCTAIYYLLTGKDFSALHRIRSDETWHFYDGAPLRLHLLESDERYRAILLGRDVAAGQRPQAVVSAGVWFGATVEEPGGFSLVGCTVAPGFEFEDFELGDRTRLLQDYPGHRDVIVRLTRC